MPALASDTQEDNAWHPVGAPQVLPRANASPFHRGDGKSRPGPLSHTHCARKAASAWRAWCTWCAALLLPGARVLDAALLSSDRQKGCCSSLPSFPVPSSSGEVLKENAHFSPDREGEEEGPQAPLGLKQIFNILL